MSKDLEALRKARESKVSDTGTKSSRYQKPGDGEMVSLKRTKEEKKQDKSAGPISPAEKDDYGYGTRFTLDKETLDKLGLKASTMPKIGATLALEAKVKVIAVRSTSGQGSDTLSMELQITDMCLEYAGTEATEGED